MQTLRRSPELSPTFPHLVAALQVDAIAVAVGSKPLTRPTGGAAAPGASYIATAGMALVGAAMMALMLQ